MEVVDQRGGAGRFDAGARRELARGAAGDGDPEHRMAGLLPRLPGGREREGLARPGLARHHHDPVRGAADVADHLLLLARQRRSPRDRGGDLRRRDLGRRRSGQDGGAVDELLLTGKQLRRGVAQLLARQGQQAPVGAPERFAVGQQRDRARRSQELVGRSLERKRVGHGAGRKPLRQRLDDISAIERRLRPGQPHRRGQHVEQLLPIHRRLAAANAAEHFGKLLAAEPQPLGALTPFALKLLQAD